ncbi:MAG TPA: glycosyltransferase [Streptomyces sp.]|nr:glycosyltransferase [Streptomyces sp.]
MIATRVFHVPSHVNYVSKLRGASFRPVPSPTRRPTRVGDLLAARSWDFFDVLHLHTVELATLPELRGLADRLVQLRKPLVVTVHDLRPNIENDTDVFHRKLALVLKRAAAALTLTQAAADRLVSLIGASRPFEIVPHGQALASTELPGSAVGNPDGGLAVFGALRPNRDLRSAVAAWWSVPPPRPRLRVLLRSVSAADRSRDESLLRFLGHVARTDRNCTVEIRPRLVPDRELVAWLTGAAALVLPYRWITHSGQLELACDVGVPLLAPDEPTLRGQLAANGRENHPVSWFPSGVLGTGEFTDHLLKALTLAHPTRGDQLAFRAFRQVEHARLIGSHAALYDRIRSPSAV